MGFSARVLRATSMVLEDGEILPPAVVAWLITTGRFYEMLTSGDVEVGKND